MIEQEIVDYIIQAQKHGLSDQEIKQNLLNAGWEAETVESSFVFAKSADSKANFNEVQNLTNNKPNTGPHAHQKVVLHSNPIEQFNKAPNLNHKLSSSNPITQTITEKKSHKLLFSLLIIAFLLAGSAYATYEFILKPDKILERYASKQGSKVYKVSYNLSYVNTSGKDLNSYNGFINGDSQVNYNDVNNVTIHTNVEFGFGENQNDKLSTELIYLNNILYLNIEKTPLLENIFGQTKAKWLKLDLNEIKKYVNNNNENEDLSKSQQELYNIWSSTKLINELKLLGIEKINNNYSYHISGKINSTEFGSALIKSIHLMENKNSESKLTLSQDQEQALNIFLSKFTAKELDLWIGIKDYELQKFHLILNVPTVEDLKNSNFTNLSEPLVNSKIQARDASRLNDMRKISTAMELYFNANGGYPAGDENGKPVDLTTDYLASFPTAPEPADGTCTEYYNSYWYTPSGKVKTINNKKVYSDYSVTFCLGSDTGGYAKGIAKIGPTGIEANIPCPTKDNNCINTNPKVEENLAEEAKKIEFNAVLNVDLNYTDINKPFNLTSPEDTYDIFKQESSASSTK